MILVQLFTFTRACFCPCAGRFHPKQISSFLVLLSFLRGATVWPARHSPKTCRFALQPLKVAALVAVGSSVVGDVVAVVAHTVDNAGAADCPTNWAQGRTN